MAQRRSCINRAATRKYILALVKNIKVAWQCERVSGEYMDLLEYLVGCVIIPKMFQIPTCDLEPKTSLGLLTRSVVADKLLQRFEAHFGNFISHGQITDMAIGHVEEQLVMHIRHAVESHPTLGKTFKP